MACEGIGGEETDGSNEAYDIERVPAPEFAGFPDDYAYYSDDGWPYPVYDSEDLDGKKRWERGAVTIEQQIMRIVEKQRRHSRSRAT